METFVSAFVSYLDAGIENAKKKLKAWMRQFTERPAHEFEWGDGTLSEAVRLEVFEYVRNSLPDRGGKATLESIQDYALRKSLNGARHPKRSTSQMGNLVDTERTSVWTELYESVTGFIKEAEEKGTGFIKEAEEKGKKS